MARRRYRDYNLFFGIILFLIVIISVYFQIQGAIQCAADGGAYLRNWANWPVCVGGK